MWELARALFRQLRVNNSHPLPRGWRSAVGFAFLGFFPLALFAIAAGHGELNYFVTALLLSYWALCMWLAALASLVAGNVLLGAVLLLGALWTSVDAVQCVCRALVYYAQS
jgi:hypothetical protein